MEHTPTTDANTNRTSPDAIIFRGCFPKRPWRATIAEWDGSTEERRVDMDRHGDLVEIVQGWTGAPGAKRYLLCERDLPGWLTDEQETVCLAAMRSRAGSQAAGDVELLAAARATLAAGLAAARSQT